MMIYEVVSVIQPVGLLIWTQNQAICSATWCSRNLYLRKRSRFLWCNIKPCLWRPLMLFAKWSCSSGFLVQIPA